MAATHTLLTPTLIAKEALRLLVNNLVMGSLVYRDYESEFPGSPQKGGGTVQIRKPVKFRAQKTRVRITTTIPEVYTTITVATQAHVAWEFKEVDLTLSIQQYSERYIRPAAAALANQIDADLCGFRRNGRIAALHNEAMGVDDEDRQQDESTRAQHRLTKVHCTPLAKEGIGPALANDGDELSPPCVRLAEAKESTFYTIVTTATIKRP